MNIIYRNCFTLLLSFVLAWSISSTSFAMGENLTENMDGFNTEKWHKADGWTNGSIFNCGWRADHVDFANGVMTLKLDNTPSSGKSYSSGEYRTNDDYEYGTFEVRMKAAKGQGIVSSFFTYTGKPWDEIDIEILGKDTTKMQTNYFTGGTGGHETLVDLGFDASKDFHTYKFVWTPSSIQWYVDGQLKVTETGSRGALPTHGGKIMMNLWPGIGVDGWLNEFKYSKKPIYASYDYVKYTKQ